MTDLKLKTAALIIVLTAIASLISVSGVSLACNQQYELGDVNHDGIVDIEDLLVLGQSWQAVVGDANFNPDCDLNGDGIVNITDATIIRLHWTQFLNAHVYIMPQTLNLKSEGKWIIAVVVLPKGVNATRVDVSSIKLNGTIQASSKVSFCRFSNVFIVKFSRQAAITLIRENLGSKASISCKKSYPVTLTVSGKLENGLAFSGSDVIRAIHLKN